MKNDYHLGRIGFLLCLILALSTSTLHAATPTIDLIKVNGELTYILARHIETSLVAAKDDGADAVIIELDTPGGQVLLMEHVVQAIKASPVPVIVYVYPTGAHAASAGTFVTLAAHLAVMAPGTTIGAASPVGPGGEDLGKTLRSKIENTLAEDAAQLAERRGPKAVAWARKAVTNAAAASAKEALALGVIDFIEPDLPSLLKAVDGQQVTTTAGTVTLHTAGARVRTMNLNAWQDFLNKLVRPDLALLLVTLGVMGIISELSAPGGYMAGITGAIALILGIYALGVLNANMTGLAFIGLAFLLFIVDIKAPTHGVLSLGGIISFVFGGAMLFNRPYLKTPWAVIITLAFSLAAFFTFAIAKVIQAHHKQPATGLEGLIGKQAEVRKALTPRGMVFVDGGWWEAELVNGGSAPIGSNVEIISHRGLRLLVRPTEQHTPPAR